MYSSPPRYLNRIHGRWTLYSSQALAALSKLPDAEIDEDWTAGELEIGPFDNWGDGSVVVETGIVLELSGSEKSLSMMLAKPDLASPNPLPQKLLVLVI